MGQYFIMFFQGLLAFLSPCILPLLPVYFIYLSAQTQKSKYIFNVLGFILGFTIIFVLLGASATYIGSFLSRNLPILKEISGVIMVLMGVNYLGIIKLNLPSFHFNTSSKKRESLSFLGAIFFGMSLCFSWTACIGPYLGSALLIASNKATVFSGILLLFIFSMGFAIPFFISALMFSELTSVFTFIKKNFEKIKIFSGVFLILIGLSLIFNLYGYWESLFS